MFTDVHELFSIDLNVFVFFVITALNLLIMHPEIVSQKLSVVKLLSVRALKKWYDDFKLITRIYSQKNQIRFKFLQT